MSIKSFADLNAWKEAHVLALSIYKLTGEFPQRENFALSDQMRRAAVSVSSNIAEGFPKKTKREKTHFYRIALGSLSELKSQLIIAKDLDYLGETAVNETMNKMITAHKLLNGLIKSAETYQIHDT